MRIRQNVLDGNPVIVAIQPRALVHVLDLLSTLLAGPLAPAQGLDSGLDPLKPRKRSLSGQVEIHLLEDDGQMQHRPSYGGVLVDGLPEADDLDIVIPQPAQ